MEELCVPIGEGLGIAESQINEKGEERVYTCQSRRFTPIRYAY